MKTYRRKYYQLEDGSMIRIREMRRTQRSPGSESVAPYCILITEDAGWYKVTDKDFDEINALLAGEEEAAGRDE
jgi:hypothetical protein